MQYRPTASELLTAIAELLETDLLPALPESLQHKARVAASLTRIVDRELRLGPEAVARERALLADLLGVDPDDEGGVDALAAELARRLREGADPEFERAAWEALVRVTRDDLGITKPGHDSWQGR